MKGFCQVNRGSQESRCWLSGRPTGSLRSKDDGDGSSAGALLQTPVSNHRTYYSSSVMKDPMDALVCLGACGVAGENTAGPEP